MPYPNVQVESIFKIYIGPLFLFVILSLESRLTTERSKTKLTHAKYIQYSLQ